MDIVLHGQLYQGDQLKGLELGKFSILRVLNQKMYVIQFIMIFIGYLQGGQIIMGTLQIL